MWELDYKESWAPKTWCFWTVVLEKTLESPLDCKELQLVHPNGDESWVFIGRTDVEAETPILWPPNVKSWLIWKNWERLKARGEGDDIEWGGWMASVTQWTWVWVNSGSWCCSPWGCKESDTTECLNNNKNHPVAVGFLSLLNCFTMFCHFLLYSKVSYTYTYIQSF